MAERARQELLTGLESLYKARDWSDLVLVSKEGSQHDVHRAIVCPRSRYFQSAVKQAPPGDDGQCHLTLDDDDNVIKLIIEYLYLLDYQAEELSALQSLPSPRSENVKVHHNHIDEIESSATHVECDTMSVRTEAGLYGQMYGTSAVSAFGGPSHRHHGISTRHSHHLQSAPSPHAPFTTAFRSSPVSPLTAHAIPSGAGPIIDFTSFDTALPSSSSSSISDPGLTATLGGGKGSKANPNANTRRHTALRGIKDGGPSQPSPLATRAPCLTLHAKVYAAAERYEIQGLQALALDKFKIQLTRHWDSPELAECIPIVFDGTTTDLSCGGMREVVADTLAWHTRLLDKPAIEASIIKINGLAYELLKRSRRVESEYD